ncbi:MAG: HAD family hydrolase [Candidatus Acidiferrales bacterium]
MKRTRFSASAVLFDWDGTLVNSYGADSRAYLAMFQALGINWGLDDLARHYSPNWYHVYRAARLPRAKWDEADRIWTHAYKRENPRLMPGARQIVRSLQREFTLGIVTSGNRPRVRKQLRQFQLAEYFSACVCCEDAPKRKPHPAPLNLALEQIGLDPNECVYVGDTAEDIEMSRRAGVRPIGVLGPFPTADLIRAARPDVILSSIQDLPRYLQSIGKSRR